MKRNCEHVFPFGVNVCQKCGETVTRIQQSKVMKKRISKQRILKKLLLESRLEPLFFDEDLQMRKPGEKIKNLSEEERNVIKDCTAEDFK